MSYAQSHPNLLQSQNIRGSSRLPPLRGAGNQRISTEALSDSDIESNVGLKPKPRKGYELADFNKALDYLHSQSYTKKVIGPDGVPDYEQYDTCVNTDELKKYGLGVYLYLQFIKRLAVTLLVMSAINILPIVYAYFNGTALKKYTESYMITLAKTSLGNLQNGNLTSYLAFTAADILSMLTLFGFYLHWRSFHAEVIEQEARDPDIVNPTTYALSVIGFDPQTPNLQANLKQYLNSTLQPAYLARVNNNEKNDPEKKIKSHYEVYQVEVMYDYNGQFSKFVYYDELVEKKEKEKQVMIQTGKSNEEFLKIEKEIAELEEQLAKNSQVFEPTEAIIHFQSIKSKMVFINFCRSYSLIDTFSYSLKRFFCCQHLPPQSRLFMGKDALMIKSNNLSRPEQINWQNLDIGSCGSLVRWILSIIFLLISILITSSLIALCTLYVSSTSACSNYDPATLITKAVADGGQTLYCFCASHFADMYTVPTIQNACANLSNTILYANIMQVGASLVSSVSNVLLIIAVGIIGKYVLKPASKPKEYSFIFVGVLISNYINASVLPLVMNGDIFGLKSISYLTFIDFIDFNKVAIFKDYNTDWYAVVGPYYMNFLIIANISPIINLLITCLSGCYNNYKVKKACQNTDKQNPVIQKEANKMIASMQFDLATQQAIVCLNFIICIMYSSLLPILLPITTVFLLITFFCKKTIILRYSIRIPADYSLSEKIITFLPWILLLHFLMGIWAHTASGVFDAGSYVVKFGSDLVQGEVLSRAIKDIIMLGGGALIAVWIIFDYTVITFFRTMIDCCSKDQLQMPTSFSSKENKSFQNCLKTTNILGSYKLINNPTYGHAIKAYQELKKRKSKEAMRKTMKDRQASMQSTNNSPQKFGLASIQTLDIRHNQEIPYQANPTYQNGPYQNNSLPNQAPRTNVVYQQYGQNPQQRYQN